MPRYPVTGAARYLPVEWWALDLNAFGTSLWTWTGACGVVLGFVAAARLRQARAVVSGAGWVLAIVLAAHALTVWLLAVDPARGGLSLPGPADWVLGGLAVFLMTCGPFVFGALLGAAADAFVRRGRPGVGALATCVSVYALWIAPWVVGVYCD